MHHSLSVLRARVARPLVGLAAGAALLASAASAQAKESVPLSSQILKAGLALQFASEEAAFGQFGCVEFPGMDQGKPATSISYRVTAAMSQATIKQLVAKAGAGAWVTVVRVDNRYSLGFKSKLQSELFSSIPKGQQQKIKLNVTAPKQANACGVTEVQVLSSASAKTRTWAKNLKKKHGKFIAVRYGNKTA